MPHIHTAEGEHDHSVSFFIFRTDLGEPRVMLHMHRKVGKLMMFGGHVELTEHPWSAALHEITEETGFDHQQLRILQPERAPLHLTNAVVHPAPVSHATQIYPGDVAHFHTNISYAMTAAGPPAGAPDPGESTDIRLLTRDELLALPDDLVEESFRELAVEIFDYYLHAWAPKSLATFAVDVENEDDFEKRLEESLGTGPLPLVSNPREPGEVRSHLIALIRQRCHALGVRQPLLRIEGDAYELSWTGRPKVPTLTVHDTGIMVYWHTSPPYDSVLFLREEIDLILTSETFALARAA
jgi:8-oxo-dGTP pyrophosphatase MutT (NUDIX family)